MSFKWSTELSSTFIEIPQSSVVFLTPDCVYYSFHSFNSCYQNIAVQTKPASSDIFKLKDCLIKQNVCAKKPPLKTAINTPPGASNVSHDKTPLREEAGKRTSKSGGFVLAAGSAFQQLIKCEKLLSPTVIMVITVKGGQALSSRSALVNIRRKTLGHLMKFTQFRLKYT